jgi:hypothetical protein
VIPSSEVYDVIWNLTTGILLFGATSVKLCDEFRSFFMKTFECALAPIYPYSLGERLLKETGKDPNLLYDIGPSMFGEEVLP